MGEASKSPPSGAQPAADVDQRAVMLIGLALGAIIVFCAVAVLGLRAWLMRDHTEPVGPSTDPGALRSFATPRLEPSPARDIAALERDMAQKLHQYRWIDRNRGIVQIPIERAMELLSRRARGERSDDAR